MEPLTAEELQRIATTHGIEYGAPDEDDVDGQRVVTTHLSRSIAMDRDDAYATFADPQRHVDYFGIIQASTPLIPLEGPLSPNEYVVLEHVQEANLPPRMMVVKYQLDPPATIIKTAVTDPFNDEILMDRKKGVVRLHFDDEGRNSTRLTCESTFTTSPGPVFVRGFIDHVWLRFFEQLLVETGELSEEDMMTSG